MVYTFNLKNQTIYGITGFILALIILYLFTKEFNWIASVVVGIGNFVISGFYLKCSVKNNKK